LGVAGSVDAEPSMARFGLSVVALDDESRAAGALWAELLGVPGWAAGLLDEF